LVWKDQRALGHGKWKERMMKVSDVMTPHVVSVLPETSVHEIAETLVKNRISAVPVTDAAGHLVGIVSDGDLLRRVEIGTEQRLSRWLDTFLKPSMAASEYVKAHGRKAEDVMTPEPIAATEEMSLSEAAMLLEKNHIKRLPVVRGGQIVGIVSRANLVQALATAGDAIPPAKLPADRTIRDELIARIRTMSWTRGPIDVTVHQGVVSLWGQISSEEERRAIHVAAENTPGVWRINDHLFCGAKPMA
jgi:CBS domain-containing protein